jgi:hypothetical protein
VKRLPISARAALPLALVAVWALSAPTFGSLTAQVTNNSSSAGTTSTLLTATDTSSSATDCTSSISPISSTQTLACTHSTVPGTVPSSGTSSQQVTLSASGGAAPGTASYTASSCGPVELADQSAAADPMLVRGGVTYAQGGPLTGSASLGLDGSSALAADVVSTSNATLGTTFTAGVWFKTTSGYGAGGSLIGFGSSASTVSDTSADKILSMTTAGKLNFAISGTLGTSNTTSPSDYNDGNWHLAVVTVSTTLLATVTLYVDGSQVAQATNLTLLTGYTGYWHVGWSPVSSGSAYLAGSLADAFVVDGTALSPSQVSTLSGAGSQSAWNTDVSADGASMSWGLGDAGTTTFSGSLPVIGATSPCTMVSVATGGSTFCIYSPNSAGSACASPTASSQTLSQWVAAGAQSFPATSLSTSTTITTTVTRSSTYNTTYMPGLRLYLPVTLTEKLTSSSPWYTTLNWTSASQQVTA